jgi:hypothetical protein
MTMPRFSFKPRGIRCPADERGFVLVGVVMFILALTILGLSLFALSSYEAQFQTASYLSGQAFNVAQGGVEHAKFVLANMTWLQDVRTSLYPSGVIYARARRLDGVDPDTVGKIADLPNGTPLEIRVLANLNGERRMVESHFTIDQSEAPYKRLMSITDSLYANPLQVEDEVTVPFPACGNTWFNGEVWEGGKAGKDWANCADASPSSIRDSWKSPAALPTPDVNSFFTQHINDPATVSIGVDTTGLNNFDVILTDANSSDKKVTYFKTDGYDSRGIASLYIRKRPSPILQPWTMRVHVSGWVVWMLPKGFRTEGQVEVIGSASDCLVIVAGSAKDSMESDMPDSLITTPPLIISPSLAIRSSLKSQNVPVILVTDGWAVIEHAYWPFWLSGETVNYLTVFARAGLFAAARVQVPPLAVDYMNLNHPLNSSYDQKNQLIDRLINQGALPNAQSGGVKLTPVAGTWRELNPDNPPN